MSNPSISLRTGFRWLPDDFAESTLTLVLTTPQHHFVDLRVDLPLTESSNLSWGFAGTASKSQSRDPAHPANTVHGKWRHEIDSTSLDIINDEGFLCDHPTIPGSVLEWGSMNDSQGVLTSYEEIWADEEVDGPVPILVMELISETSDVVMGKMVRIGRWCQGIMRGRGIGGEINAERWELVGDAWKRVWQGGDSGCELLCNEVLAGEKGVGLKVGQEVSTGYGEPWQVIEVSS